MTNKRLARLARFGAVITLSMFAITFLASARAFAAAPTGSGSSSIGVQVDQPTTTIAPTTTTTAAQTTTTTAAPTPTTVPDTTPVTAAQVTTTTIAEVPTTDTLPEVLPAPVTVAPTQSKGVGSQLKSAAKTTKALVSGITSGEPVADVAAAVLPQNVANVVVPAVRTASTFVFPIGLAAAVIAFLVLQQRIDAGDPKLTAAPMAHDQDLVEFL